MAKHSRMRDQHNSFGWVSIALHWLSAIVVIAMWFIGNSITDQPPLEIDARRSLHVTVGLSAWVLLAARIIWRLMTPHPHVNGQTKRIHRFARATHYVMLATLGIMLLSGPLLAWLGPSYVNISSVVHSIHRSSATLLVILTVLHILGALKHLMFHDDDTIVRMLWPRPNSSTNDKHNPA